MIKSTVSFENPVSPDLCFATLSPSDRGPLHMCLDCVCVCVCVCVCAMVIFLTLWWDINLLRVSFLSSRNGISGPNEQTGSPLCVCVCVCVCVCACVTWVSVHTHVQVYLRSTVCVCVSKVFIYDVCADAPPVCVCVCVHLLEDLKYTHTVCTLCVSMGNAYRVCM